MSIKRPFTALNGKQIRKDFPKTFKSIREWMERCGEVEGNVITEEMMMAFFYGNPRFLYDYFDDMKIHISVTCTEDGNGTFFTAFVKDYSQAPVDSTRKSVEESIFNYAFTLQEAKL